MTAAVSGMTKAAECDEQQQERQPDYGQMKSGSLLVSHLGEVDVDRCLAVHVHVLGVFLYRSGSTSERRWLDQIVGLLVLGRRHRLEEDLVQLRGQLLRDTMLVPSTSGTAFSLSLTVCANCDAPSPLTTSISVPL